jgi:hypothetical protein
MLVLDDFLDRAVFLAIREQLLAPGFPWEQSHILSPRAATHLEPAYNRQQVHGFFLHKPGVRFASPTFEVVRPVVDKLRPTQLIKVKVNLTTRQPRHVEYGLHVDTRRPGATTAIYYLNTNNGYTVFGDGTKVASVENRMVIFEAARLHTGASCTDADYRLVLNINLLREPAAPA